MTQDEIIEMAKRAGMMSEVLQLGRNLELLTDFAKLVAAKKEAEMQDRVNTLHAMYEKACKQRDELMDAQRSMVAAMRGRIQ